MLSILNDKDFPDEHLGLFAFAASIVVTSSLAFCSALCFFIAAMVWISLIYSLIVLIRKYPDGLQQNLTAEF